MKLCKICGEGTILRCMDSNCAAGFETNPRTGENTWGKTIYYVKWEDWLLHVIRMDQT
jgi:hypothetical protein